MTGLCGILIVLVLVTPVDLVTRRVTARPSPALVESGDATENEESLSLVIATLRAKLAELQEKADDLRKAELAAPNVEEKMAAERAAEEARKKRDALQAAVAALRVQVRKNTNDLLKVASAQSQLDAVRNRAAIASSRLEKAEEEVQQASSELAGVNQELQTEKKLVAEALKVRGVALFPFEDWTLDPVFAICDGRGVRVCSPRDANDEELEVPYADTIALRAAFTRYDTRNHTVVLLVRPSGVRHMDDLYTLVTHAGFACGRDPLEEDMQVEFNGFRRGKTP